MGFINLTSFNKSLVLWRDTSIPKYIGYMIIVIYLSDKSIRFFLRSNQKYSIRFMKGLQYQEIKGSPLNLLFNKCNTHRYPPLIIMLIIMFKYLLQSDKVMLKGNLQVFTTHHQKILHNRMRDWAIEVREPILLNNLKLAVLFMDRLEFLSSLSELIGFRE